VPERDRLPSRGIPLNRYGDLAVKVLRASPESEGLGEHLPSDLVDAIASLIGNSLLGTPVLPKANETVAVTFKTPRTAALFFDRIWCSPGELSSIPQDIAVYGATVTEIWPFYFHALQGTELDPDLRKVREFFVNGDPAAEEWIDREMMPTRLFSEALARERGVKAIPFYESMGDLEKDYRPGHSEVIVAALSGLGITNEKELSWDQVIEFRNDSAAKTKLRRLRHWLDSTIMDKPLSFVCDEIAIKLDDYEWALKKHGIKTITGTATELLDPKFLACVAASSAGLALAGAEFWATVGAVGALLGRVALSVTTKMVDLAEATRSGSEVAVIHDIKKLGERAKLNK
jgi:hypothetical protein